MNHTIHEKPKRKYLLSGIGFILVAILFFILWKDQSMVIYSFFLLNGLFYLTKSNYVFKSARLEMNEEALLFFNQLNIKYKTLPLSKILGAELKEDSMILDLPRNNKKTLTEQVYQHNQLTTLHEKLTKERIEQT